MNVCQCSNDQGVVGLAGSALLRWSVRESVRHDLL